MYYNLDIITRAVFKYAQRCVMKNEQTIRADSLARRLQSRDRSLLRTFWKEVKTFNCGLVPMTYRVDDVSGGANIGKMWRDYYHELFNSGKYRQNGSDFSGGSYVSNDGFNCVQVSEIQHAINELPSSKSVSIT